MDFIPSKRDTRYLWYKNLSQNIVAEAVKFGLSNADALAAKGYADAIIAKYDDTAAAQNALDAARNLERSTEQNNLLLLRNAIRNWKTLAGYPGSGSEAVLQLKGSGNAFEPSTYKPKITAVAMPGGVEIDFRLQGADAVNIYMRRHGGGVFVKLGMDTSPPYTDTTPLSVAGTPEVREYQARGVVDDVEIGLPSDIVSVTFAG